jgi:hypothetical protein
LLPRENLQIRLIPRTELEPAFSIRTGFSVSTGCDWSAKFIVRPSGRVFFGSHERQQLSATSGASLLGLWDRYDPESPDFRDAAIAFSRISIAGLILLQTDGALFLGLSGSEQISARHPPILLGFPDCARQDPWAARSENHFRRCESAPSSTARKAIAFWCVGSKSRQCANASLAAAR